MKKILSALATAAAVIASQAGISGTYSLTRQCMQLGYLPRMTVRHTSTTEEGQIYIPQINTAMFIGVVVILSLKLLWDAWLKPGQ
mgnify:CR=1 FL=1